MTLTILRRGKNVRVVKNTTKNDAAGDRYLLTEFEKNIFSSVLFLIIFLTFNLLKKHSKFVENYLFNLLIK